MRISDWSSDVCSSDLLAKFIASKGSVALDGVSLTVNEVDGTAFGVNIIPHTAEVTTLGARQPGDRVNLELDMLARYVQRLMAATAGAAMDESGRLAKSEEPWRLSLCTLVSLIEQIIAAALTGRMFILGAFASLSD